MRDLVLALSDLFEEVIEGTVLHFKGKTGQLSIQVDTFELNTVSVFGVLELFLQKGIQHDVSTGIGPKDDATTAGFRVLQNAQETDAQGRKSRYSKLVCFSPLLENDDFTFFARVAVGQAEYFTRLALAILSDGDGS